MAVAAQLTVYPEKEMTAWPVRPKFNYGDPYDEGIISRSRKCRSSDSERKAA